MKHLIIGTAGHIDHGKTTLVKALTGCDTDRLAEEKKRGITIELGFAYFNLPGGLRAGIVDVPGHEKFIHNMASGVVGMDVVLLVIAADEGIMPQTREHIDILKLFGVEKCIIVLNKADLVDEEWLDMVETEIREEFRETFIQNAPIVRVSSKTGQGIDELIKWIEQVVDDEAEKDIYTIPRLPIDRVFTIKGFGTIVTGTMLTGIISKEDTLMIYPEGKLCKVRNIQVHGDNVDQCYAGQRAAINLHGVKVEEIKRGCVLALPDSMKSTNLLDVKIEMLDSSNRVLKNNTRLHLLAGTDEVLCRSVLLDKEELLPGESGYAQLKLERELALRSKDRFVIRFYSPLETIGGGIVLEPNPVKKKRFKEETIRELQQKEKGSFEDVIELQVKSAREKIYSLKELAKITARTEEEVAEAIENLKKETGILTFLAGKDVYVWHEILLEEMKKFLMDTLEQYKRKYPYRYGMKKAELQKKISLQVKQGVFDSVIALLEERNVLCRKNELLMRSGAEILKDDRFHIAEDFYINEFKNAGFDFVRLEDAEKKDTLKNIEKEVREDIMNVLLEEKQIVKMTEDVYTLKEYADEIVQRIQKHFTENKVITVVQLKEIFGVSRKCAKQIFEYTDRIKLTRKNGGEAERTLNIEV